MTHEVLLAEQGPRPRDFVARLRRRDMHGVGHMHRRAHRGRRVLALLAAVAVPAFAAPESWRSFAAADVPVAQAQAQPMPFEQPGGSFPGSAFYYLASESAPARLDGQVHSDADPAPADLDAFAGPPARAMRIDNSGVDRSRALQCLTAAIYYEAASEPDAGQRAVAQVVLNRVAHPSFPKTVCGVVYQGSERSTGCQFSFTCDGALARVPSRLFWMRAQDVAGAALAGYVYAPIGLATHYHTIAVHPYWDASMSAVGTIGAHRFFRFPGAAGAVGTFRFAYFGGEPMAAPHPHSSAADALPDSSQDPVALERAYAAGLRGVTTQEAAASVAASLSMRASAAPAPAYTLALQARGGESLYRARALPEATGIRVEYQNSGAWIKQPGS